MYSINTDNNYTKFRGAKVLKIRKVRKLEILNCEMIIDLLALDNSHEF